MVHPGDLLRGSIDEPAHWCPGCKQLHVLPWKRGGWEFNGSTTAPGFMPSFSHRWKDAGGEKICHYVLTNGLIHFCIDSWHELRGQNVPLPALPTEYAEMTIARQKSTSL